MRRIPLRRSDGSLRAYALVDDADYEWLSQWRWHRSEKGYAVRWKRRTSHGRELVFMHRALLGLERGDPRQADHVNRNRADNQRQNLRVARGEADNMQNLGVRADNKSGYRGVSFKADKGKWCARATLDGHSHHLGYYNTPEDANDVCVAWRAAHMPFSEDAAAA